MRVGHLYIVGFNRTDPETLEVCEGLYRKYAGRTGAAAKIWAAGGDKIEVEAAAGPILLNPGLKPGRIDGVQAPTGQFKQRFEAGAYIVVHGIGDAVLDDVLSVTPQVVAEVLQAVIPKADHGKLAKVALIQCFAASKPFKAKLTSLPEPPKLDDLEAATGMKIEDAGYAVRLVAALHRVGMRPMVVGWDEYVSVAPHAPSQEKVLIPPEKMGGKNWGRVEDLNAIRGAKIVHDPKGYSLVRANYREKHKHVYCADAEGRVRFDFAGWSDKANS